MLQTRVKKAFVGAAISVIAALGCAVSAQAKTYVGSWDPVIGGTFGNVGWAGSATFAIADSCLVPGLVLPGPGCGIQVLDAQVTLYNGTTLANSTLTETHSFSVLSAPGAASLTTGMFVGPNNELAGVTSTFIGSEQFTSSLGGNNYFGIIFQGPSVQLLWSPYVDGAGLPGCGLSTVYGCGSTVGSSSPQMTISPVPEPSTYALMLAGLGAVGFVARRRRP
jgi:hypothetical protein